jgi:hypothetical protein
MRLATLAGFYVAVVLSAQIGAHYDGVRPVVSAGAGATIDSFVFLVPAFGRSGLHFFGGRLVGKIASSVAIGIPLVVLGRRFLPANRGTIVPA